MLASAARHYGLQPAMHVNRGPFTCTNERTEKDTWIALTTLFEKKLLTFFWLHERTSLLTHFSLLNTDL